jgi:hypothetical protein
MKIDAICLSNNCSVLYRGHTKKRLVRAAMRKARRDARVKGLAIASVSAYKMSGYNGRDGYARQYRL